uniref:Ground-like domain-containing protein n=1 Tax=Steinernema glaseri TaxID=37863 RepID=A0A1I7Y9S4_9BILA
MLSFLVLLVGLVIPVWTYCPGPCGGGCAPRCGYALPASRVAPQPYYPQPQYIRGQLPYPQPGVYPDAYYVPKNIAVKETTIIKKPTTESAEEEYAITPPPRPYEESTESSDLLARPEPVPLYPQQPREIILPQSAAAAPQPQSYPVPCPGLPYPPPRPIYPQPVPQPVYPYPVPYPQPQPLPYPSRPPLPANDCCARCPAPCRYRNRRFKAFDSKHLSAANISSVNDPKCSDNQLKSLMKKNMVNDLAIAKRLIQKAAEEKFGGAFNVICSRDDFTYVSRSTQFCVLESDENLCYAFQSRPPDRTRGVCPQGAITITAPVEVTYTRFVDLSTVSSKRCPIMVSCTGDVRSRLPTTTKLIEFQAYNHLPGVTNCIEARSCITCECP